MPFQCGCYEDSVTVKKVIDPATVTFYSLAPLKGNQRRIAPAGFRAVSRGANPPREIG
jgi:hypothetical protein